MAPSVARNGAHGSAITDGPVPKHAQLRSIIEEMCERELSPGDPLPGERALEEAYGVSRITVRRAIGDLVSAGRLRRVRGKGTFVAPAPLVSRLQLASFSDEMTALGVEATSNVLLAALAPPPAEVADFFGTPADHPHIRLKRVRLGDGQPYSIDDAWYNADLAPGLLESAVEESVYSLLDFQYRVPVTHAEQTVTAVAAGSEEAARLDVDKGTALLHIVRLAYSGTKNVEYCASVYRTDRYRLATRVERGVE